MNTALAIIVGMSALTGDRGSNAEFCLENQHETDGFLKVMLTFRA